MPHLQPFNDPRRTRPRYELRRGLSLRHEAIIDYFIARPQSTMTEAAVHFECSVSYLCTLASSDAFREELAKRRSGVTTALDMTVRDQLVAAAKVGLDRMMKELPRTNDLDFVRRGTSDALKALGYGQPKSSVPDGVVQTHIISREVLQVHRERIIQQAGGVLPSTIPETKLVSDQ